MRNPRALALAVAGALVLSLATACTDGGDDKALTVYSGRSEKLVKPILEQFTKSTGIKLNVRYGDTAQMAAQLLEEGDKSPASVFLAQDAGALGAVSKKGLFTELPDTVLNKVSAQYRANNKQWVGLTGRARVLTFNPTRAPYQKLPKSVFELTGPLWKNKVAIAPTNASFQSFVTAMRLQHGDDRTRKFLTDLKANGVQIRPNNDAIVNDVHDQKVAAGLVNHYYLFEKSKEVGVAVHLQPARMHFFAPGDVGSLVNVSGIGVLKTSTGEDAVKLVDYLLGADAQTYFANNTYEYPMAPGIPLAEGMPALDTLKGPAIDLNNLDDLAGTVAMLKEVGLA
ncbi:iron ABC transporter substrate-binding protein [Pilimelia columellifera]|uniref:Iron ABC transporter substrate-binding protein n=1 Tax=Pilimelia columellifera subsp. columellifera TaxID=706583 RepID=A0ABN3NI94_9ACTN